MKRVAFVQVLVLISMLSIFLSVPVIAQQTDCPWEGGCLDDWVFGSVNATVEVTAVPPCSIVVTAYYMRRCAQYEVQDYHFGDPGTLIPPGCIDWADYLILLNTPAFRTTVNNAVANAVAGQLTTFLTPSLYRCPLGKKVYTSKYASCRRSAIVYTFPDGSKSYVNYNAGFPWSYYENLYLATGGVVSSVALIPCSEYTCCFRTTNVCWTGTFWLITYGAWNDVPLIPCPENQGCPYTSCGF